VDVRHPFPSDGFRWLGFRNVLRHASDHDMTVGASRKGLVRLSVYTVIDLMHIGDSFDIPTLVDRPSHNP
jgi:hypothetical protein